MTDTKISLAIRFKLKKIFERDSDTFLTFPIARTLSLKSLKFMEDLSHSGLTAQEQLNFRGEFARLLNVVPEDRALWPNASRFLWTEVKNVLRDSIVAQSTLNQGENTLLEQAS
jgi:hypothetical protein